MGLIGLPGRFFTEFELKLKPFGFTMQPKPSSSEKDTTGLYSSINNKDDDMDSLEGLFRDWSIGLSRKDEYPIFSKLNYQTRGRLQLQKEKKVSARTCFSLSVIFPSV